MLRLITWWRFFILCSIWGSIEWLPQSLDHSPLDFFLWGHFKSRIYSNLHASFEDLLQRITNEDTPLFSIYILEVVHTTRGLNQRLQVQFLTEIDMSGRFFSCMRLLPKTAVWNFWWATLKEDIVIVRFSFVTLLYRFL